MTADSSLVRRSGEVEDGRLLEERWLDTVLREVMRALVRLYDVRDVGEVLRSEPAVVTLAVA